MKTLTPVSVLFKELRKLNYTAVQRAGDCRSCVYGLDDTPDVFTTDQSYNKETGEVWVYFGLIEETIIKEVCDKFNIKYDWDGLDSTAFTLKEAV